MSCGCGSASFSSCGCQSAFGGCSGGSGSGGSFVFNKDLIPISDNVFSIGSSTKRVKNLYLGTDLILSCGSVIRQNTVDGDDSCIVTITGAGFPITSRGAIAQFGGNESILSGGISFETGSNAAANFTITATNDYILTAGGDSTTTIGGALIETVTGAFTSTVTGVAILDYGSTLTVTSDLAMTLQSSTSVAVTAGTTFTINTGAANRWQFEADGDLAADATNGGNLIITATNKGIILGATTLDAGVDGPPRMAVVGNIATGIGISLVSVGANTTALNILGYKTRSTSTDANTSVVSGDELLAIVAVGADGTNYEHAAAIRFFVDGTPGNNDMPGRIGFFTTPDGSNALAERWRIDNAGNFIPLANSTYDIGNTSSPSLVKQLSVRDIYSANVDMAIGTTTGHDMVIRAQNVSIWRFQPGGVLLQDATNGGDIVFNKALSGVRVTNISTAVTAAGASSAAATVLTTNTNLINAGSGGVRLPAPQGIGHQIYVQNALGGNVNVYPTTGGIILGVGGADAPLVVATNKSALFTAANSTNWFKLVSA